MILKNQSTTFFACNDEIKAGLQAWYTHQIPVFDNNDKNKYLNYLNCMEFGNATEHRQTGQQNRHNHYIELFGREVIIMMNKPLCLKFN